MNLSEYLKGEIVRRNLSVRKAADHIGISHVTLLRILSGETPNLETLNKISEWTHADLVFLLELLGYHVEAKTIETDRLARLIEYDPTYRRVFALLEKLGPDQLQYAVDYLEYLTWRLGEQQGDEQGVRRVPPPLEVEGDQEGQGGPPEVPEGEESPADVPLGRDE